MLVDCTVCVRSLVNPMGPGLGPVWGLTNMLEKNNDLFPKVTIMVMSKIGVQPSCWDEMTFFKKNFFKTITILLVGIQWLYHAIGPRAVQNV
jgi:hypothetical protein